MKQEEKKLPEGLDLEKEIERMKDWWEHNIGKEVMPGFENIARHFYELGKNAK